MKPLTGIKILDMTKVLAGPICTQYLGDMGAEIIKLESPKGDDTRHWPPFHADDDGQRDGTVFLSVNRNKRSIAVDLKTEAGRDIVRKLAAEVDVVVESNSSGVAERLGIDYASLNAINPRLVYCSISGFGRTGPLANTKGYDLVLQAFTGVMAMTGEPGGKHIRVPLSPIDQATGLNAQAGILAALFNRERSGQGAYVEVSLFESAIGLLGFNLQRSWKHGRAPEKSGTGHESLCPYQVFKASDGDVLIGVANDRLWQGFCKAVGRAELAEDQRFATNAARVQNSAETNAFVAEIVAKRSIADWVELLTEMGVPCVPINDVLEIADHPQTLARGMVQSYDHPVYGQMRAVANPVSFGGIERDLGTPPPLLGQHSLDILAELGLSADQIDRLVADGVVTASNKSKE
ncbi:CoA transferase [Devosia sp. FJ2-5-3]|uniref:CaiB/BaiF CoA transferase family protein n=1 Tax=Devosia sp. FJ2-5-3 TaxID=2976680 RepID=UPI0023D818CE|nr:CoA transferase [Devosia sp. FJ2-5-3]WEJ57027.1 CoA transferase [Devosia sp. FJ2-5-3]